MPGVRSARWAGPDATDADNNALLLRQLFDVADPDRTARFVCAIALVLPDGTRTRPSRRDGGSADPGTVGDNGFGYDPLFVADGQTVTNACSPPARRTRSVTAARRCGRSSRCSWRC